MKIKALKKFWVNGNKVKKGDVLEVDDKLMKKIQKRTKAYQVISEKKTEKVRQNKAVNNQYEKKTENTSQEKTKLTHSDVKHVGGGWYEVKGQKVQGKEEALKIARGD